ncbi:NAD(P)-dependent oxidoreductase [Clostridium sp. OS1-26]|uniref:NAD(P)-dependent oxidoreductase n=1 Tax=Clostridium sp. OS1-26 TaxID=3070681 RepID=UPI0027DF46C5|nr:NAD(P)-dependent oxidoreductase [Clostridium sp. OS1-26]WML33666.1 NAD(P)-dependent oxidoreductase [Clostridium sp. OS1-26]
MNESDEILPREEIIKKYSYIDGLITAGTKIDKEFLDAKPNLKVVSNISVGYDNFVIKDMKERRILGTNTPDVLNDTVADLTFALILAVGLDVFKNEPIDKNNPLLKMNNVITLPHIGSGTHATRNAMSMIAAENMIMALIGKMPKNLVKELK